MKAPERKLKEHRITPHHHYRSQVNHVLEYECGHVYFVTAPPDYKPEPHLLVLRCRQCRYEAEADEHKKALAILEEMGKP